MFFSLPFFVALKNLFGGGVALVPPPMSEITQLMNQAEFIEQVSGNTKIFEGLSKDLREYQNQTRELQIIQRQLSSVPSNWDVAGMLAYKRNLTSALNRIQGVTWSAADTSERLNKAYPLWEASEGKTFKEQYVAMAQNTREATSSIFENLNKSSEKQLEYSERIEKINTAVNQAPGQTAATQAYSEMLQQLHQQLNQLGQALDNQAALLANFLNRKQAMQSQQMADREAAVPVWVGDPDPLSGPGTDMKWK